MWLTRAPPQTTRRFRKRGDKNWKGQSRRTVLPTVPQPPFGWRYTPVLQDSTSESLVVGWEKPPNYEQEEIEYKVAVADNDHMEALCDPSVVLPGTQQSLTIRSIAGIAIKPNQAVWVDVRHRLKADREFDPDQGWRKC